MLCNHCGHINDVDATFCTHCGSLATEEGRNKPPRRSSVYLPAFILVSALIAVAALGYYKFVLPNGVLAVVNGEEIREQDLDAEMRIVLGGNRINSTDPSANNSLEQRLRYEVLMRLIRERIMLQEAKKADLNVTNEEVSAAAYRIRKDSGMDEKGFSAFIENHYGDLRRFEDMLRKRLIIERLISRKIAPGLTSPESVQAATAKWLHDASTRSNVRIALSQQWSGDGCGCCNRGPAQTATVATGKKEIGSVLADKKAAAARAAVEYWRKKYGDRDVTTDVTDFGCHMQIDITKEGRIIKSLRYQNGQISEI